MYRQYMRPLIAIAGVLVFATLAAIATTAPDSPLARPAESTAVPTVLEWPPALPTEQALPGHLRLLAGFALPVATIELPADQAFLPNSRRDYRAGYHEGIDFVAKAGVPVMAAKAGTIVRVDSTFTDWSVAERQAAFDMALALGHTPDALLDRIRGRQVWIDHGDGIVTRYAHLEAVAPLRAGDVVIAGRVIGAVGSSGYPEGGPHLHFEIRDGDGFYGDGLALPQLRYAISAAFR
ncbi:MAG: M23 family metallopeptidase [Chloroflexota bacterium]